MQKKTRREYEAPMVEIFEARVEKGFQSSGTTNGSNTEGVLGSRNNYTNALFS